MAECCDRCDGVSSLGRRRSVRLSAGGRHWWEGAESKRGARVWGASVGEGRGGKGEKEEAGIGLARADGYKKASRKEPWRWAGERASCSPGSPSAASSGSPSGQRAADREGRDWSLERWESSRSGRDDDGRSWDGTTRRNKPRRKKILCNQVASQQPGRETTATTSSWVPTDTYTSHLLPSPLSHSLSLSCVHSSRVGGRRSRPEAQTGSQGSRPMPAGWSMS